MAEAVYLISLMKSVDNFHAKGAWLEVKNTEPSVRKKLQSKKPLQSMKPLQAKKQLQAKVRLKTKKTLQTNSKPIQQLQRRPQRKPTTLLQKTAAQLVKPADESFSRYVRLRDSEYSDGKWVGTCITCTKTGTVAYIGEDGKLHFSHTWNNGHFVTRGNYITRFEEENCNLQCAYRCNKMRSGEYVKYKAALKLKYGDEVPGKLEALADEFPGHTHHFTKAELLQIIRDSNEQIDFYIRMATK